MSPKKGKKQPESKGRPSRVSWILLGLAAAVALAGIYLVFMRQGPTSGDAEKDTGSGSSRAADKGESAQADFQALVGRWET